MALRTARRLIPGLSDPGLTGDAVVSESGVLGLPLTYFILIIVGAVLLLWLVFSRSCVSVSRSPPGCRSIIIGVIIFLVRRSSSSSGGEKTPKPVGCPRFVAFSLLRVG